MGTINEAFTEIRRICKQMRNDLEVPDSLPNSVHPPAMIVLPRDGAFNADFGGDDRYFAELTLLVGSADNPSSLAAIVPMLEMVKDKFDAKQTLNGKVQWCRLVDFGSIGKHEYGGVSYFGCIFNLEIHG